MKKDNPDASQRRSAHRIKVISVLAMNDIASSQDPYTQVLNLLVAVTLQCRVWIDEGRAEQEFGPENGKILVQSLIEMRREVWGLAERVMTAEQMERLEFLITAWRRRHPDQDQVSFVKFDEFASSKASNLAKELRTGGGLLAPLDEAAHELQEYRRLAERAFWYTKRAPSIAGIQAEAASNEIMASPEITQLVGNVERVTATVERVQKQVSEVVTAVTDQGPQMATVSKELLGSVAEVMRESRLTIAQAESGMKTANTLLAPFLVDKPNAGPPGRPFNILEYTEALRVTKDVLHETNQLAGQSETASVLISRHLGEAAAFTDARVERVFHLLWITLAGLVAGCAGLILLIFRLKRSADLNAKRSDP
jgi:hypothetical protein